MKKLLSILAAVGLTATASTAVVACTDSVSYQDAPVLQNGYVSITNKKITLLKDLDASAAGTDITSAQGYKENTKVGIQGLSVKLHDATKSKIKKGKSVKVDISFFMPLSSKTNKKILVKLGDGKKLSEKITVKTPLEWDNGSYDGTNVTFKIPASMKKGTFDSSKVAINKADGSAADGITGLAITDGQLVGSFKAPAREKDYTQQFAYTIVNSDENLVLGSNEVTFTVPANGLPLGSADNGGNDSSPVTPNKDGKVTQSFNATFKSKPEDSALAGLFAITTPDGKKADAIYTSKPATSKEHVLADGDGSYPAIVTATITIDSKLGSGDIDLTINTTNEAKGVVTAFTPVKITVEAPSTPTDNTSTELTLKSSIFTSQDSVTDINTFWGNVQNSIFEAIKNNNQTELLSKAGIKSGAMDDMCLIIYSDELPPKDSTNYSSSDKIKAIKPGTPVSTKDDLVIGQHDINWKDIQADGKASGDGISTTSNKYEFVFYSSGSLAKGDTTKVTVFQVTINQ